MATTVTLAALNRPKAEDLAARRSEFKATERKLKQDLARKEEQLKRHVAKLVTTKTDWASTKSDTTGRSHETTLLLAADAKHESLKEELRTLELAHEEAKAAVSNFDFLQRERLVCAAELYRESVAEMTRTVKSFEQAVAWYSEAKKPQPRPKSVGLVKVAG